MTILAVRDVARRFGGLAALGGVTLDVRAGEIRGLIGPNGSGKSTFFNVVSGILRPDAGTILFDGTPIQDLAADRRQHLGLGRTFQEIQLFYDMTVLENVMVGAHRTGRADIGAALLRPPWQRAEERRLREAARECLDFVGLGALQDERARTIAYGHQRLLEIARALAAGPRLLLLDEPAAGMNPAETRALMGQVERIVARGVTVFLVEHNMKMVMGLCERITVLHHGQVIAEGTPAAVQAAPAVLEAYLGRAGA
ncbi:MAG: ABC transporter ATP-binding protein [Alphaproteobacteria bacterium]|nr:ABC transporter ATP-binding protein [Alphaproteobacteria bacterium]